MFKLVPVLDVTILELLREVETLGARHATREKPIN